MLYSPSLTAILVFTAFVGGVLGLSFWLGRRAKSSAGYFAAHGQVPWFINGVAFAGDYLSAASFLGICGMIAFFGYDGFLYSIGYLAGWVVALFVIAEPIKRLGKFTFADALDAKFNSRGIRLTAAISTLVVSIFYLIPQMVGAGALVKPLLGLPALNLGLFTLSPFTVGVLIVGIVVTAIVVTAGMVSTTWVQFIKGALLVLFCGALTLMILNRGLMTDPPTDHGFRKPQYIVSPADEVTLNPNYEILPETGPWLGKPYVRVKDKTDGILRIYRETGQINGFTLLRPDLVETQYSATNAGKILINGKPHGRGKDQADFYPVGHVERLPLADSPNTPEDEASHTGPIGPLAYLSTIQGSTIVTWATDTLLDSDGTKYTIYYPRRVAGADMLLPGNHPTLFKGVKSNNLYDQLNFFSLMLALFFGTAALPHILIRYYTVKDASAARKSTVVGIATIGLFYILTLYLGLGAMTSGALDVTNSNMAAPLLARTFGELPFAIVSAIAFTTVLGTVCGLIMAASGAVAHDLMAVLLKRSMDDFAKIRAGKIVAIAVGIIAMLLGILFEKMNVTFLVGWAFNIAASANLPALVMLLFWRHTTAKGIAASVLIGMTTSLLWIFLSADAYVSLYGLSAADSPVPFNQPAIVTVPLSFLTLVVVSLFTRKRAAD